MLSQTMLSASILAVAAATPSVGFFNVSTSTEIVTAYTTYCPEATSFVEGNSTYVVTEATTLTITDCPCTRTHTFTTSTVTVCPSEEPSSTAPQSESSMASPTFESSTSLEPVPSVEPTQGSNTTVPYSNNANRVGLSCVAAVGAAMLLL